MHRRGASKGPSGSAVVTARGQSAERPVDDTAWSEDDMDEVSPKREAKRQRGRRQNEWFMEWPVVLGVLVLVVVVLSVLGYFVANLTSRFQELERKVSFDKNRIEELERKILIDKDIDQLRDDINTLETRSSDLKSVVEKMDETIPKLVADVEKLDNTFGILKPKVDEVDETVVELKPKVEKMDETVVTLEPKIKTLDEIATKLEPKVGKLDETVDILKPNVENLDEIVAKLKPKVEKMDEIVVTLEPKIKMLDEVAAKLEPKVGKLDKTVVTLEPIVERMDKAVAKLEPSVENLDESVAELKPKVVNMDEIVVTLEPKIKMVDEVATKLEPKVRKIDETVVKLDPKIEEMDKAIDKLEPTVGKLDKTVLVMEPKVNDLKKTVDQLDGRVQDLGSKVSGTEKLRENVTEIRDLLDNLGNYSWKKLPESLNRLDNLELTSRSQYSYIYLLLLMTVGLTLWSLYSYSQMPGMKNALVNQQYELTSQSGDQTPSVHEESYWPVGSVLDSIQLSTLARQICVVSFYSETKAFHMRLVESACSSGELSKVDKVGSLVSNHETIPKLPRAKIFLVFVDFNERDIILEHPDREIGDLRMTTVQGARKMGGDVFVVYVKDKGSQNLNSDHLYNERLRSIITHPELSVLSGKQRVLTTYDEFTTFQRTHLAKSFVRTLQR
ncbi:myosin heavy chain, fast skeletal muscle-like [Mizuhopecten yessoensis]|uniref:myosin heavy chain, fast skeletal muscle-like n=1 Tax=Mizuhopecten yessoensis TaxID=6573 RepID=UPI000B45CDB8|nr:myosin heavy chain, fast skeletal muscle-like [Mizuhopecten yessoensis]